MVERPTCHDGTCGERLVEISGVLGSLNPRDVIHQRPLALVGAGALRLSRRRWEMPSREGVHVL